MTKDKETILSSGRTLLFQIVTVLFWLTIPIGFLISSLYRDKIFFGVMISATYGLMSLGQIRKILKLKSVSFDKYNIYIKLNGGIQEIPFYEVKDINLKDVTGIHCIELGISHGRRKIYFKSSLWYPFNYKKVDGQVNQLYKKIQESKMFYLNNMQKGIGSPTINI